MKKKEIDLYLYEKIWNLESGSRRETGPSSEAPYGHMVPETLLKWLLYFFTTFKLLKVNKSINDFSYYYSQLLGTVNQLLEARVRG